MATLNRGSTTNPRGRPGRTRGRGRPFSDVPSSAHSNDMVVTSKNPNKQPGEVKPRPTHFLALPLGHHPSLRTQLGAFQTSLLRTIPPITGLDKSIVIDPRRAHLTLGVMALDPEPVLQSETLRDSGPSDGIPFVDHIKASTVGRQLTSTSESVPRDVVKPKTLTGALELLRSLRPRILRILSEEGERATSRQGHPLRLRVPLSIMDVMKPTRGPGGEEMYAHVLWVGPEEGAGVGVAKDGDVKRLVDVCELVHKTFKNAGYIVEQRPLKLHCTILNTSHRKPRGRPFSYSAVLASEACQRLLGMAPGEIISTGTASRPPSNIGTDITAARGPRSGAPTSTRTPHPVPTSNVPAHPHSAPVPAHGPLPVNLGTWEVDEIQLCLMGSHGPENEYVSCGGVSLSH